jgi:chromosome segregation ATPase
MDCRIEGRSRSPGGIRPWPHRIGAEGIDDAGEIDQRVAAGVDVERDAASRTVDELEKRVSQWRDTIDNRRNQEAEKDAAEARLAAAKAQPAIRQLADENARLAEEHQELSKLIDELDDERQTVDNRREKLDDERKEVEEKIKAAGLTDAVGQMLRKQRSDLATVAAARRLRSSYCVLANGSVQLYQCALRPRKLS